MLSILLLLLLLSVHAMGWSNPAHLQKNHGDFPPLAPLVALRWVPGSPGRGPAVSLAPGATRHFEVPWKVPGICNRFFFQILRQESG